MKNVDIDEIDKLPGIPIKESDTFCFRCHPGVSCFKTEGSSFLTSCQYGKDLEENLQDLSNWLKRGAYRAKPVHRKYVPKTDGRQRPNLSNKWLPPVRVYYPYPLVRFGVIT